MGIGETYGTGKINRVLGIYECLSCKYVGLTTKISLSKGERFPPCEKCESEVVWRLIKYTSDLV